MYKLLVVDDEKTIADGIKAMTRHLEPGIEAAAVYSAEEALDYIKHNGVQICVTDIKMTGMTGLELIDSVLKLYPRIKFIIISSYDYFDYAKQALKKGVLDYLVKPIRSDEYAAALDRAKRAVSGISGDEPTDDVTVVDKAVKFIKENYTRQLTLAEVANHVSYNYSYFSRLFAAETGMSFLDFLHNTRMQAAENLIRDPLLKINEIALKLGYTDPKAFYARFKKYYGVSPAAFRKILIR